MSLRRPRHTTVPAGKPARRPKSPMPPHVSHPALSQKRASHPKLAPRRDAGRILDQSDASLVDVIDNLLSKGVLLHADLILALAGVELVYVRLSTLLCAADRVMPNDPLP